MVQKIQMKARIYDRNGGNKYERNDKNRKKRN